jgi:ProP effector
MMSGFSQLWGAVALPTFMTEQDTIQTAATPDNGLTAPQPTPTEATASAPANDQPDASPAQAASTDRATAPADNRPPRDNRGPRREGRGGGAGRSANGKPQGRKPAGDGARRPAPPQHPVLAQLATLYPTLFGAKPLPLKRGILQDLLAAQPEVLTKDGLKEALALYTRSTRYLTTMASGQARHDLAGNPVEAVAPEHQHHALLEVFKRRHARTGEDVRAELYNRMLLAAESSGMAPADYALRVRNKDDAANAILDDAVAELTTRVARDQALLQAFEASGKTVNDFAGMYGLHPIEAAATLNRARARAEAAQAAAEAAQAAAEAAALASENNSAATSDAGAPADDTAAA